MSVHKVPERHHIASTVLGSLPEPLHALHPSPMALFLLRSPSCGIVAGRTLGQESTTDYGTSDVFSIELLDCWHQHKKPCHPLWAGHCHALCSWRRCGTLQTYTKLTLTGTKMGAAEPQATTSISTAGARQSPVLLRMISCGHYTQLAAAWVRDATCKGAPRNACLKTDSCTQAWQLTVAMQQAAPNCMRSLRPPRGLTRGDTQRSTAAEFELGKRLWPSQTVQGPRERVGCPRSCHANSRQAPALLVQTPSEWPREQKPKLHHLHHPRRPTPVDRDTCF